MASPDSFTLSARVPHKTAEEFKTLADSLGLTPNALIKDMVERAVTGKPAIGNVAAAENMHEDARKQIEDSQIHVPRMYGVALNLVDDLLGAGYPDSEIEKVLTDIRREML